MLKRFRLIIIVIIGSTLMIAGGLTLLANLPTVRLIISNDDLSTSSKKICFKIQQSPITETKHLIILEAVRDCGEIIDGNSVLIHHMKCGFTVDELFSCENLMNPSNIVFDVRISEILSFSCLISGIILFMIVLLTYRSSKYPQVQVEIEKHLRNLKTKQKSKSNFPRCPFPLWRKKSEMDTSVSWMTKSSADFLNEYILRKSEEVEKEYCKQKTSKNFELLLSPISECSPTTSSVNTVMDHSYYEYSPTTFPSYKKDDIYFKKKRLLNPYRNIEERLNVDMQKYF
ncbi:hypothetical protein SNEBB_000053 [Seison nebaliae]|nr:hypothetical protein SNEBB_000053 [Seison nebaliae]